MANPKLVGRNYTTPDLVAKVTGRARYAEDFRVDGMLFCKLLLSPMPHCRVRAIDTAAALALPGVKAVLTADDLPAVKAPDGERIAFVGMRRGHVDLFVVTVATGETAAVTDDAAAELHPIWTPDGRALVFATDGFTSDQARGAAGPWQLARLPLDTRRPERLAGPWAGHMRNPQWADAAGTALFFVGDLGGVPNLWRLDLATGAATPATDLTTGVTLSLIHI